MSDLKIVISLITNLILNEVCMNRENNSNTSSSSRSAQGTSSGLQQKLSNFLQKGTHSDQEIMDFCETQCSNSSNKNADNS